MSDAGPPPPPPPPAVTARRGASNVTIAIVSTAALVLLVALGVGVGVFVISGSTTTSSSSITADDSPTRDDEADDEDDEEEEDEASTPTATPVETPAPAPVAETAPVLFQSVSGNIVCSIDKVSAVCHQNNIKYTAPSSACDAGLGGATVGVDRRSAYWPCLSAPIAGASSVDYDVPVEAYSFSCNINYVTGVTCYNEDGAGFTMEYTNGVFTF